MDGLLQAAICAVLVALNCGQPRETAQTDSATVACFRGLEPPYTFANLAMIRDGGSMQGVVRGARDEQQSFFYECGMLNRRCGVYIGTENPWIGPSDHTKWGRLLEPGSECEAVFIGELRRWVESVPKDANETVQSQARRAIRIVRRLEEQRGVVQ